MIMLHLVFQMQGISGEERLTEWELLAIKKNLPYRIFPLRRQLFALTMLKEAHMTHDKLNVQRSCLLCVQTANG